MPRPYHQSENPISHLIRTKTISANSREAAMAQILQNAAERASVAPGGMARVEAKIDAQRIVTRASQALGPLAKVVFSFLLDFDDDLRLLSPGARLDALAQRHFGRCGAKGRAIVIALIIFGLRDLANEKSQFTER